MFTYGFLCQSSPVAHGMTLLDHRVALCLLQHKRTDGVKWSGVRTAARMTGLALPSKRSCQNEVRATYHISC